MASFLKIFGPIEHFVAKGVEILYPPGAGLAAWLDGQVTKAEASTPQDGQGPIKLSKVALGFDDYLSVFQGALARTGLKVSYDKDKLNKATSARVQAYNALMEFQDSIKVDKI